MSTDERVQKLIVRMQNDRASAAQVRTALRQHMADVDAMIAQQNRLDVQYAESLQNQLANNRALAQNSNFVDSLRADLSQLASEQDEVARATRTANDALDRQAEAARRNQQAVAGSGRSGLEAVDRAGSVGSQILGGLGQGEAANISGLVGDTVGALTSLSPPMLAITAVGVALAPILGQINKEWEEGKERAKAYLAAQVDLNQLIAQGATTSDIQEQIDNLNAQIEGREATKGLYQSILDEYDAFADEMNRRAQDDPGFAAQGGIIELVERRVELERQLSEATGGNITSIDALRANLETFDQETQKLQGDLFLAAQSLNSAGVAANDAIARAQSAVDLIRSIAERENELNVLRRTGTSEAIRDQIAGNRDLVASLEDANARLAALSAQALLEGNTAVYNEYQAALVENLVQINELTGESRDLTESVLPLVELREREAQAIRGLTDLNQQRLDALENEVAARTALNKAMVELADFDRKAAAKELELTQAAEAEETKAKLKADDERRQNDRKAQESREKQEQQHRDNVLEIQRRANATLANAMRTRDVVAAILAQEARDEELRKENKANEDRQREIEDQLREQNDAVKDRLSEQLRTVQDNSRRQLEAERRRVQEERAIRQQAVAQAEVDLRNAQNAVVLLNQIHYVDMRGIVRTGLHNMLMDAQTFATQLSQTVFPSGRAQSGGSAFPPMTPFSFVVPNNTSPSVNVPVTINATSRGSILRQIDTRLRQIQED